MLKYGKTLHVWLLLFAFLSACTVLRPVSPEVSLVGVEPVEMGLLEQRFLLKLRVVNPGENDITLNGLRFELEINGQPLVRGVSNQGAVVPRLGEAVLNVNAGSDLFMWLRQMKTFSERGSESVRYRLHGYLSVPLLGDLPFERAGETHFLEKAKGSGAL